MTKRADEKDPWSRIAKLERDLASLQRIVMSRALVEELFIVYDGEDPPQARVRIGKLASGNYGIQVVNTVGTVTDEFSNPA